MARGRKPTATAIKKSRGSFVKDPQRRNENEPTPNAEAPPMPDIVKRSPKAVEKWHHLCGILDQLGLLASSDSDLMAAYSITWATWIELQLDVWSEGVVVDGKTNPKQYEVNKSIDRLYKLGAEFGLSPSSRTRLSAAPKDESDPFLDYLKDSKN
jgi:P27 family predicted phage terminase small subunit